MAGVNRICVREELDALRKRFGDLHDQGKRFPSSAGRCSAAFSGGIIPQSAIHNKFISGVDFLEKCCYVSGQKLCV